MDRNELILIAVFFVAIASAIIVMYFNRKAAIKRATKLKENPQPQSAFKQILEN